MSHIANPTLLIIGLVVLSIGWRLYRWSGRHDIVGLAKDAAWKAALSRGKTAMTPEIQAKMDAFHAQSSTVGRAGQAAGIAIRHLIAQVVGIVSYVAILGGAVLAAAGIWWR